MNFRNSFVILFVFLSCILNNTNSQDRLLGGSDLVDEKARFSLVSIFYACQYRCTGTLITLGKVLTSEFCLRSFEADLIAVFVGQSNYDNRMKHGRHALNIIRPQDFTSVEMDISVITLKLPFLFAPTIIPLPLCKNELKDGVKVQVIGWGSKDPEIYEPSHVLQSVVFELFPFQQCEDDFKAKMNKILPTTAICLMDPTHASDSCWGDAGSPAVLEGRLYAVLGSGIKPGENYPTAFTNMCNKDVLDFINSVVGYYLQDFS